ncbi:vacuolar fusion protein MON1, putative [Plasmodium sp. gorilla clade G3]|nr:vacuolar fusion protein MON1, putative [Plasmodium sp. gorilla clade G3]
MEITCDNQNSNKNEKEKNIISSTYSNDKDKLVDCVFEESEIIQHNTNDDNSLMNDDIKFYDVNGIDDMKEDDENVFLFNKEEYCEQFLMRSDQNVSQYEEVYNSYTDDDLEKFFEDKENNDNCINNNLIENKIYALQTDNHHDDIIIDKDDIKLSFENNTLTYKDNQSSYIEEKNNITGTFEITNNIKENNQNENNNKNKNNDDTTYIKCENKSFEENSNHIIEQPTLNEDCRDIRDLSNEQQTMLSLNSVETNNFIYNKPHCDDDQKEDSEILFLSEGEPENVAKGEEEKERNENEEEKEGTENEEEKKKDIKKERNENEEDKKKDIKKERNDNEENEESGEHKNNNTNEKINISQQELKKEHINDMNTEQKYMVDNKNEMDCQLSDTNIAKGNLIKSDLNNIEEQNNSQYINEKVNNNESNINNDIHIKEDIKNLEFDYDDDDEDLKSEKFNKKLDILNYFENNENQDNINNSKFLLKKKKINEDQTNTLWYKHKRHFFIFTFSGKPVFTRYGNEENLTSFFGTLLAILSKVETFNFNDINSDNNKSNKKTNDLSQKKNTLKYIISNNTKVVFLDKEVLYLVCISKVNESINYIMNILNYIYSQIISLLTKSIDKSFQIKPSFDIRYLLDGADLLMCNLISSCSKNLYSLLDGFEPLPLKPDYRNKVHNLISSFKINNVLLSFLIIDDKIIGLSLSKYTLNSMDIIILINMITSMKSFKNAESWTPICLPIYNPNLFLYAYINYIKKKICCVYICSHASSRDFFHLSRHTSMIESTLISTGCYDEIVKASNNAPFAFPQIPGIDIIHLCYYIPYLKQYYSSKISNDKIKRIFRVYQKCDDIMKDCKLPTQIYIESEYEKFYCIKTNLYHLYLSVPFYVIINDENINEILKIIATYHKEIFINNIKQITS